MKISYVLDLSTNISNDTAVEVSIHLERGNLFSLASDWLEYSTDCSTLFETHLSSSRLL